MSDLSLQIRAVLGGLGTYYLFPMILVYLIIGYIVAEQRNVKPVDFYFAPEMSITFAAVTLMFTPLFALGLDWGRWVLGISVIALSILTLKLESPLVSVVRARSALGIRGISSVLFGALLVVAFLTRVPECCLEGSGSTLLSNPALDALRNMLIDLGFSIGGV